MRIRNLLREPLLHFVALGALLFAAYGWLGGTEAEDPDEIVVDAGRIESLVAGFERVWQRPPTPEERAGLIDAFVREEILYREGIALGLDRDDPVIRRRVGQKMSFLADGAAPQAPSRDELRAWLDAHAERYAIPARWHVEQIYFDPARRGDALDADVAKALRTLERDPAARDAEGDSTQLPASLAGASQADLERVFGRDFAAAIAALPVGTWQGPIRSGYGVHLVRVTAREDARAPALDDVAAEVERDFLHARAQEASEAFFQSVRARHRVRIDDADVAAPGSPP